MKHFHIPKLLIQYDIPWYNGEIDSDNILGNSLESAIRIAEKAFYVAFLEKLKPLSWRKK